MGGTNEEEKRRKEKKGKRVESGSHTGDRGIKVKVASSFS